MFPLQFFVRSLDSSPKMAFSACIIQSQMPLRVDVSGLSCSVSCSMGVRKRSIFSSRSVKKDLFGQQAEELGTRLITEWGSSRRWISVTQLEGAVVSRKRSRVYAELSAGLPSSEVVASIFKFTSSAIIPFYILMVAAPKAEFTKKLIGSSILYSVLALLYAYFLCLSWAPDTFTLVFSSELGQPELSSIKTLFSRELSLASVWIHILVVDLFVARHVFQDGLRDNVETRHSVLLCLLSCPLGVLSHFITKALTKKFKQIH